ncbi:DUF4389 domain-containing protein [Nocardioides pocheonensis]|uniref:DUF4389 domain-containing protein n=1 Tax=Nocardioides pocheonensis TaxID=661485 RepID=A0A3N0GF76_9ACTN|nr:DUF4389 domain-containing protein [Nocardioides pocheonensis]RNM11113.1 DUF4389 domain-containing protein [Nocardioides pocheonensis]
MTAFYPVHVEAHIDPKLSRWQWLFKWLLAIPHYIVLAFLWLAFVVLSFVAFFTILFTGRYPRGIFDFNVGVLRWTWRVSYYAYGALGTDRYPPFSLQDVPDYPAHLEIDYPERLSRGLVLVKWWLLAIPHYLVVGLFLGGVGWAASDATQTDHTWQTSGGGLISLLVLFAAVVLLFSGRYPRSIFDLVLGLNRWVLRVAAYAALMTDVYPPFRLDQGGDDPSVLHAATGTPPSGPAAGPMAGPVATTSWPADPAGPAPVARVSTVGSTGAPASVTPSGFRWSAGRIVALVAGSVFVLASAGVGLAGGALAVADHGLRDHDGFLMSGTTQLTAGGYAIATTSITLDANVSSAFVPEQLLGSVKVTATGTRPVFLGIARTADANAYLRGVEHATLTDFTDKPVYETSTGGAPSTLPTASDIWVAQVSGSGTQELIWPARSGEWTLVVMNADGSSGVTADAAAGATVPALDWLVPTLLVTAGLGLVVGVVLLVVALRRGAPSAAPAATPTSGV